MEKKTIRNADIALLHDVFFIMQDIRALEERRAWQRERMSNISQHLSFTGGGGEPKGLDSAYAALSGLEEEHSEKVRQYKRALKQAENIVNGIASLRMRTLVMMLYVEDIPAREVRERLNMSRRRFDAAVEAIEQAEDMAHVKWRENAFSEE